ncbi:hypothetical protein jhhlp_000715 [Lomentospora prolificans]|uniref:Zn(2)-C6 fungal-type domain-containing protein n=1 Tax=Lomentospora prolificans TaxID=41688 RepID=A0A2N3NJB7_9PEZI|nr:hypothetical protein jhhlp_000715 [Lomentospora prolificans]
MPDSIESPIREPRPKRQKIDVACDTCRTRKVKCDGVRPACGNCSKRSDLSCHYSGAAPDRASSKPSNSVAGTHPPAQRHDTPHIPSVSRPAPPPPPPLVKSVPSPILRRPDTQPRPGPSPGSVAGESGPASVPSSAAQPSPSVIDSMTIVLEDGESTQQYFGSSSAGSFTRQIKAAIDARLGVSPQPAPKSNFLSQALNPEPSDVRGPDGSLDYVLPPRRQADHLTSVYWFYVDPLYPFLDRQKWDRAYEGLFTGGPIDVNERVFVTTLNVIFALATQLVESLHPEQRDDSSNVYFRRAQDLLRLNLWDPGSFEVVQCLLLMSQYLQSTNNPHQTWMVVGSAIRTAQSLGLHLPETTADMTNLEQREMLRRIWYGCVLMDRMVSVTHGRPAMVSDRLASDVPLPLYSSGVIHQGPDGPIPNDFSKIAFFTKSVELYEIINSITLAFYSGHTPRSRSASRKSSKHDLSQGPSHIGLDAMEEDLGTVMKLDESLTRWEHSLPDHIRIKTSAQSENEIFMRQAVILRIRFLQARLLLLRPTLSRFCLQPAPSNSSRGCDNLRNRVIQECASFCVATAQRTISLMTKYQTNDGTVGLLPAWWYRVYYIYSAATILIATKLRPDFFAPTDIKRSWDEAMTFLQAHEKFGQSARRCIAALTILSSKIMQEANEAPKVNGQEGVHPVEPGQAAQQQMFEEYGEYPDLNLAGLSFDAGDLSFLNVHVWELLNHQP